jgi:hypothetical protein
MLNDKQKSLLSLAVAKSINQGSGIEIADRALNPGEFAPIVSVKKSGGVVFNTQSIPQAVCEKLGLTFLPVVDHQGCEQLALCVHGGDSAGYKLIPLALIDARDAASLVSDLMVSASHYSDPTLAAEVTKSISDAVIAGDLGLKDALVSNTEQALQKSFANLVNKRLEAKQREFDAAIAEIERRAEAKAANVYAKQLLELAEIAGVDQTSVRHARLAEMLPEIKKAMR